MEPPIEHPRTEAEALIYYIQKMDLDMIELILKSDTRSETFNVDSFIKKMSGLFEYLSVETALLALPGFCDSDFCHNSCNPGYLFIAPIKNRYFSLLFNTDNGKVWEIDECFDFKIFNKKFNLKKYYRIFLLQFSTPDELDMEDSQDPF